MSQDRSNSRRKCISLPIINLRLKYARDLIFDGVFECDDFVFRRVELVDECVECGCFSGASWSRDQYHSLFFLHRAFESTLVHPGNTQSIKVQDSIARVQDTTHDALTIPCRQRRDTNINVCITSVLPQSKLSVLWNMGDIEFEV